MKRLLLLFCIIFAVGNMSPAWSTGDKKPKKPYPTVLVKKVKKAAPKIVKAAPEPATPSIAVLPSAGEMATATKTSALPLTPWQAIAAEQPSVTVVVISPTTPTATPPPTNPYLQQASYRETPTQPLPTLGISPLESLKSVALFILPDGIGQMHPPLYVKYIEQPKTGYSADQKPILLFQVSCPTKALFGFDTPIIAVLQLGVDGIIDMANAADILPVELQKVCN